MVGGQEGSGCGYNKAIQKMFMVMELFSIYTLMVDTSLRSNRSVNTHTDEYKQN